MAINPLQLPQQGAIDSRVDWAPLKQLADLFNQKRDEAEAARLAENIRRRQQQQGGDTTGTTTATPDQAFTGLGPIGQVVRGPDLPPVPDTRGYGIEASWAPGAPPAHGAGYGVGASWGPPGTGGVVPPPQSPPGYGGEGSWAPPPPSPLPGYGGEGSWAPPKPPGQGYGVGGSWDNQAPQVPQQPAPLPAAPTMPVAAAPLAALAQQAPPPPTPAPEPAATPYSPAQSAIDAGLRVIKSKETGGERQPYAAQVDAGKGRVALGAYGILNTNLPEWSKQALGRTVSEDEFLRNPQIQDQIARYKFGQYANKYGLEGAARAWLAGERGMNTGNADRFGSTPMSYAADFRSKLPAELRNNLPAEITTGRSAAAAPGGDQALGFSGQPTGQPPQLGQPPQTVSPTQVAQAQPPHVRAMDNLRSGAPASAADITPEEMGQLYRNPLTRPLAQAMLQKQLTPEFKIEKVTMPDGSTQLVRVRTEGPEGVIKGAGSSEEDTARSGLTGEDFLKTLPEQRAMLVKGVAEGRVPPPPAGSRSPQAMQLLRDVSQYEPGLDLTLWKSRNAMQTSATSGKIGQNLASFETVLTHLNTLDNSIDALGNTGYKDINALRNSLQRRIDPTLDTNLKAFEAAKTSAVDELVRAFRGTGGNVHDLVQWESLINAADSPQALHGVVKQAIGLLKGRMDAVADEYNKGMQLKVPKAGADLISPRSREIFERLEAPQRAKGAAPGAAPGISQQDAIAELRRRGAIP